MDEYKSLHEKSLHQSSLENGYVKVTRNIPNGLYGNQDDSLNGDLPESVAYASVERKSSKENPYASADKKTPQANNRPMDEYAQVDMRKKKKTV